MKRTDWKASIGQLIPRTKRYRYIERRVYVDADGIEHVKINGSFVAVDWLRADGRTVDVYYEVVV